jgi:hypothetical protein
MHFKVLQFNNVELSNLEIGFNDTMMEFGSTANKMRM